MGVGREDRANGMEGHIVNPRVPMGWGGGEELEVGFSRLLKMTANIEVNLTVPDDVNLPQNVRKETRTINFEEKIALATPCHAIYL